MLPSCMAVWEINVKLPYNMDGIILNIPALLEELPQDAYLTEFIPAPEEETEEETVTDEMDGLEVLRDF